jgi:hypothetical protein
VFHTIGVPPRTGSTIFAIIGSSRKSRKALRNSVAPNSATTLVPARAASPGAAVADSTSVGVVIAAVEQEKHQR